MKASILMTSRGGVAQTMDALQSVADGIPESIEFEVVFVDNGSSDGTAEALHSVEGDFVVLRNERDLGTAEAWGQAAEVASGQILVALGEGVVVQRGCIESLLGTLAVQPSVTAVRPYVISSRGAQNAGACVALRRPAGEKSLDGAALLLAERTATVVADAIVSRGAPLVDTSGCGDTAGLPALHQPDRLRGFLTRLHASPERHTSALESLVRVFIGGDRHPAERAIAGTILVSANPSRAVEATVCALIGALSEDERALIGSVLKPDDWHATWTELLAVAGEPSAELFWNGFVKRPCEYDEVLADLQLLNDVLARSALAGRYWMIGGMLIGWARDRDLIRYDLHDFDFAFTGADYSRFTSAMIDLVRAGFMPRHRFPSITEPLTELTLSRHGTKFEFYRMEPDGPDLNRYYSFGHLDGVPIRNTHTHPRQRLVPVEYLDRLWMKSEDHELELSCEFGDWRTPDPNWNYMKGKNIIAQDPWKPGAFDILEVALWQ